MIRRTRADPVGRQLSAALHGRTHKKPVGVSPWLPLHGQLTTRPVTDRRDRLVSASTKIIDRVASPFLKIQSTSLAANLINFSQMKIFQIYSMNGPDKEQKTCCFFLVTRKSSRNKFPLERVMQMTCKSLDR